MWEANIRTNRIVSTKWTYHKERSFASSYFENSVSVSEPLTKSCLDVKTTQMSIFILFVSAGILFESDFSLWVLLMFSSYSEVAHLRFPPHSFRLSKVWGILHHGSVGRIQKNMKNAVMYIYSGTFFAVFVVFHNKVFFLDISSSYGLFFVKRKCQLNCMLHSDAVIFKSFPVWDNSSLEHVMVYLSYCWCLWTHITETLGKYAFKK